MMKKTDLYKSIDLWLEELGITYEDYPINSIKIAKRLKNLNIEMHAFYDLCIGAWLIKDDISSIVINSRKSSQDQNFDCMHELVHLRFHNKKYQSFYTSTKKVMIDSQQEWEANEGAAQALVPYQLFIPELAKKIKQLEAGAYTYDELIGHFSRRFNVVPVVIERRICGLEYEIRQAMRGINVDKIVLCDKRQEGGELLKYLKRVK